MGKPLSRPGCFRKSSCCMEKHRLGEGGRGGQCGGGGEPGFYGDGYAPQRSVYDTACINQQVDSLYHLHQYSHPLAGSWREGVGAREGIGAFNYSLSGSLKERRPPADAYGQQPRSLTPNPSFVRRLDERELYESLRAEGRHGGEGGGGGGGEGGGMAGGPGRFVRSASSPSASTFSSAHSSKKQQHQHRQHRFRDDGGGSHHGHQRCRDNDDDAGDSNHAQGRHLWKVAPQRLECVEVSVGCGGVGGGFLFPHPGGNASASLTSPLISPFSGSPLSSGYRTPVFFSPAKARPVQSQSLCYSPPPQQVAPPRLYSQTQSLRYSPPPLPRELGRAPLVQLSARDLQRGMEPRGRGGWERAEREREREWDREREMEREWAEREWERERERGRRERERARERSMSGCDRDSVFLEPDRVLDTAPLLLPTPPPCTTAAPRMGVGAVGRSREGSRVGSDTTTTTTTAATTGGCGGGGEGRFDPEGGGGVSRESWREGGGDGGAHSNPYEARARHGVKTKSGTWTQPEGGPGERDTARTGSKARRHPEGGLSEGHVSSGTKADKQPPAVSRERPRGGTKGGTKAQGTAASLECCVEAKSPAVVNFTAGPEANGDKPAASSPSEGQIGSSAPAAKSSAREVAAASPEIFAEAKPDILTVHDNESGPSPDPKIPNKTASSYAGGPGVEPEPGAGDRTGKKSGATKGLRNDVEICPPAVDTGHPGTVAGDKNTEAPVEQLEEQTLDAATKESVPVDTKGPGGSQPPGLFPSNPKTRPGTATGLRPPASSGRQGEAGTADLMGPPAEGGAESTWPRRIVVRKRTVRQGGAVHNLPILPPLPAVLCALERRHLVHGRYSSRETSSRGEQKPGASLAVRASLKEQCLEQWRLGRFLEDPEFAAATSGGAREPPEGEGKSPSEGKGEVMVEEERRQHEERSRKEEKKKKKKKKEIAAEGEGEGRHKDRSKKEVKREVQVEGEGSHEQRSRKEKEKIQAGTEGAKRNIVEDVDARQEGEEDEEVKRQNRRGGDEDGKEGEGSKMAGGAECGCREKADEASPRTTVGDPAAVEDPEPVGVSAPGEGPGPGGDGGRRERAPHPADEGPTQSWDVMLELADTLWDEGWDAGPADPDADFLPGSLQRWPLLRPPTGFGGSHPPSSAASELSLTELERRARELDADLEHLDLSRDAGDLAGPQRERGDAYQTHPGPQREREGDLYQTHPGPQRERGDVYQTHPGPQRERVDMYQTHPATQRDKASLLTGAGSSCPIRIKMCIPTHSATDTDPPLLGTAPSRLSHYTTGICSLDTRPANEDSTPGTAGPFFGLAAPDSSFSSSSSSCREPSNQSPEDDAASGGSDPGGSSGTSLERDGEDGVTTWAREESLELQWCYPSILNTCSGEEEVLGDKEVLGDEVLGDEEALGDEEGLLAGEEGRAIVRGDDIAASAPVDHADVRKRLSFINDSPLALSPSKASVKWLADSGQPMRSSGLDCGDLDPFVQSDSFVYLAVSTRPPPDSQTEIATDPAGPETQCSQNTVPDQANMPSDVPQTRSHPKPSQLIVQHPEEGDFLSTDSFVYLAAPACLLLDPEGSAGYTTRETDSESSGSGPVDASVLGCGSVAGDSDWDSDASDCDHKSAPSANKNRVSSRARCLPGDPGWDLFADTMETGVLAKLFTEEDHNKNVAIVITAVATAPEFHAGTAQPVGMTTVEHQLSMTKKVTWQFKPAQKSVCTGSRKERENELAASSSSVRCAERNRPSPSSSSFSSSSSSSPA